ncbi:S8 family peptidase [Luteolibacter sp. GHJ8]|uniref:S8 family peptidase n=1 Tax=Luteolibacter rhizosphaerae TaxID=2989719 RepID=A0ABT3G4A5_9BACT|nr:S8 family peptidase [Luteolibacter rhizosphaerae]MCW1914655.1 S8 family peptidase [Luteolibacter rhizosphaerae]
MQKKVTASVDIIASGSVYLLEEMARMIKGSNGSDAIGKTMGKIEDVFPIKASDRLRVPFSQHGDLLPIEFGVHQDHRWEQVGPLLVEFLAKRGASVDWTQSVPLLGLEFFYGLMDATTANELSQFSTIRVVRHAPTLRTIDVSIQPLGDLFASSQIQLPKPEIDSGDPTVHRVAVFDGGLAGDFFAPWAREFADSVSQGQDAKLQEHGFRVTSALLFGNLPSSGELRCPRFAVDHFRVLDNESDDADPYLLPRTLRIIRDTLEGGAYEFSNISIGPQYPVVDDDIHPWTATLDGLAGSGNLLISVAAGNTGQMDSDLGYDRVQVPADGANVLSVGAADLPQDGDSVRAAYSSVGPGRPTGYVKPDVIAFGGGSQIGFRTFSPNGRGGVDAVRGTSFSAPSVLRAGVQMREIFGDKISTLGIRCLLINAAQGKRNLREKGWGVVVPNEAIDLCTCGDGEVRVIYQGNLIDGQYVRSPIPSPVYEDLFEELPDDHPVEVAVTLCVGTEIDPFDAASYTRRGVEAWFTHRIPSEDGQLKEHTRPFFQVSAVFSSKTEQDRRAAGKWETVLHQKRIMELSSLRDAAIRLHPMSRFQGERDAAERGHTIPYAMVVAVKIPEIKDLYDRAYRKYSSRLEILTPVRIQI